METNNLHIGFIGYGNMGQAMATGWVLKGKINPNRISASARDYEKLQRNCEKIGIQPQESSERVVETADIIVLAVKPYQIKAVVAPLKDQLKGKIVLSVAAGITTTMLKELLHDETAVMSFIPNTPVSIGEGIMVVENNYTLSQEQLENVVVLLKKLGIVEFVETEQLSVAGTLAGCGPAFAAIFIEALADGAVKYGFTREESYRIASQMLVGTGKMLMETNEHPGKMKDAVTSPGGTTIKGVAALEENGFRNAVIKAFDAIEGE